MTLEELSIFSSENPSEPKANPGTVVKSAIVSVGGIDVKVRLMIACASDAIHHKIEMDWIGQGSASKTPDRHVRLAIVIRQGDSKYEDTIVSALHGSGQWDTRSVGGETGENFLVPKKRRSP